MYHLLPWMFPLHGLQLAIDEAYKLLHLLIKKSSEFLPG